MTNYIGRRFFTTDFHGQIYTILLISATGYATEMQFLRYVGKKGIQNAIRLAKEIKEIKKQLARQREIKKTDL